LVDWNVGGVCLNALVDDKGKYPLDEHPKLLKAYGKARSSRFEYGEHPTHNVNLLEVSLHVKTVHKSGKSGRLRREVNCCEKGRLKEANCCEKAGGGKANKQAEMRNLLSSFFITLLIGIAYQEMVSSAIHTFQSDPMSSKVYIGVAIGIFFLTSMRFFIGNQLHLISKSLLYMPGLVWFYDLFVIILQSLILIGLGYTCRYFSPSSGNVFPWITIALYGCDIIWILSQWAIGKIWTICERELIPWPWAVLNFMLVISIVALLSHFPGTTFFTPVPLAIFAFSNFIAFVIDVLLVDYYDVI